MRTITIVSFLVGYLFGLALPVKVVPNPNTLPAEQRQEIFY